MRKSIDIKDIKKQLHPRREQKTKAVLKYIGPTIVLMLIGRHLVRGIVAKACARVFEDPKFRLWLKESDDKVAVTFRDDYSHLLEASTPVLVSALGLKDMSALLAAYLKSQNDD